jgi:hypothetical protein
VAKTIRFHLDEHVDVAIAGALRRYGIDVTTTVEAGLLSVPDDDQLSYGAREGRMVVTHDDDLLALDRLGVAHARIAFCHHESRTIREMVAMLILIWEICEPDEMCNHVEYI